MLEKLFGSNARVKILKLFLTRPEEKFYIREIARDLKLQLNSVRRELDNLEKFGLLTSDPDVINKITRETQSREEVLVNDVDGIKPKNSVKKAVEGGKQEKKYYKANTTFVLYEEIKSLIMKAQILYERDFVQKVKETGKPQLLVLTGLFVNTIAPVDILAIGKLNKAKMVEFIKELESELGREVNYSIMDHSEFKFRRDITDVFLYEILEGKKIVVIDELELT